ncbi:hypothetical protein FM019_20480 [Aliiglaciecola sp. M165]|nr:hypothetical protein FM019_20480 [Aliiglaciecola sp. M165]
MAFACLHCRTSNMRHFDLAPSEYPLSGECPVCKNKTFNLGRDFKPPKKSNEAQWKKIEFLIEHGFQFQKVRLVPTEMESVAYPKTLTEAKEFVVKYKKWAIKSGI